MGFTHTGMIDSLTQNNQEMARFLSEQRAFEWGFGRNQRGELSLGVTKNALVPAHAVGLTDVSTRQIASSSNQTVLITSQGQLYLAGSKVNGKVVHRFKLHESLSTYKVRMVACNDTTTLCLLENQTVVQLAGADQEPKLIAALAGLQTVQIDCGEYHYTAVDQNGDLYTWGCYSA